MNALARPMYIDAALDVPPDPRGPMTDVQAVRLRELAERAGVPVETDLTMRQAEHRIEELEAVAW
ncbi:DUF3072 domain-containing protein [Salipiger sp.]|uniref:DUF3072 domain-containing protein n=1 Tax=Salipiger sp. TaxID=2078585 RepID=UPI003A9763D2